MPKKNKLFDFKMPKVNLNIDLGSDPFGVFSNEKPVKEKPRLERVVRPQSRKTRYRIIFTIDGVTQSRTFTDYDKAERFYEAISVQPNVERVIPVVD